MIRIDDNFVFEQTGENRFHLVRETYPRYAEEVILDLTNIDELLTERKSFLTCIDSKFIRDESTELNKAENIYGKNCMAEIGQGTWAEMKILYAVLRNDLEWLNKASEKETSDYFWKLDGYRVDNVGVVIRRNPKRERIYNK